MSIESEENRLDIIRALGGLDSDEVKVRYQGGKFDAILEQPVDDASFDGGTIESTGPMLMARTSDVQEIRKGTLLTVTRKNHAGQANVEESFRFTKHEPDGTGMSRIILSESDGASR